VLDFVWDKTGINVLETGTREHVPASHENASSSRDGVSASHGNTFSSCEPGSPSHEDETFSYDAGMSPHGDEISSRVDNLPTSVTGLNSLVFFFHLKQQFLYQYLIIV
jgi:hypothetical protein